MRKNSNIFSSILIGVFVLIAFACNEEVLDVKPTLATEGTYFDTEAQFREGVLGVYSKLVYFYNYRGGTGNYLHDVRLLPGDDLTTSGGNAYEVFSTINADQGKVSNFYKFLYQIVTRANTILQLIEEKGDEAYDSEEVMKQHTGELLFLRAFANFELWNYFGVAPLLTDRVTSEASDSVIYPSNSEGNELLDQAIEDLQTAAPLLPASWPDDQKGRVTQAGGYGLLGKALLFRATVTGSDADYQAAIAAFDKVTGKSLVPYGDNFSSSTENNDESLFEVQFGKCITMCNVWLATDDFSSNGDISGYWGFFDNHWSLYGTPIFKPTESLLADFDTLDPRYDISIANDGGTVQKYVEGYGGDPETSSGVAYFNNARVLRYADVLLLKAEALVQSGGSTSEAIALINQVRERARNSVEPASEFPADRDLNVSDRTTIMRWIIEERRIELAFEEGHRWLDLRRWHLGGVLNEVYGQDLSSWDFSSVREDFDFGEKNLYLPIPLSELLINENLEQNSLWGN